MPTNPYKNKLRAKRNRAIAKLYPKLTMQKIAEKFGLSRERISKILRQLKH